MQLVFGLLVLRTSASFTLYLAALMMLAGLLLILFSSSTPMSTFLDGKQIWKEKGGQLNWADKRSHQNGPGCQIKPELLHLRHKHKSPHLRPWPRLYAGYSEFR